MEFNCRHFDGGNHMNSSLYRHICMYPLWQLNLQSLITSQKTSACEIIQTTFSSKHSSHGEVLVRYTIPEHNHSFRARELPLLNNHMKGTGNQDACKKSAVTTLITANTTWDGFWASGCGAAGFGFFLALASPLPVGSALITFRARSERGGHPGSNSGR